MTTDNELAKRLALRNIEAALHKTGMGGFALGDIMVTIRTEINKLLANREIK